MIYYYTSLKYNNIETSDNVFQWLISYPVSFFGTNVPFYVLTMQTYYNIVWLKSMGVPLPSPPFQPHSYPHTIMR
jgi:hypothetical protein